MNFELTDDQELIRKSVAELASKFDDHYWMERDLAHEFPRDFYQAIADGGWLGQGIQFPLADSLARLDAAELMLRKATWLYDKGKPCGREANTAKYLCADAGFIAADRALQTHGGMGYAEEYHVARYFREARLMKIAPVSQEMILNFLGSHVLGMPRSY
jgi:alkylation response protein AidB-like acyl-CoA dehydrogenase